MTAGYWAGVLTFPALAALVWAVVVAAGALRSWWRAWRPTFIGQETRRASHAASLAVARRVLVVRLPGGRMLAWRSTVSTLSNPAKRAWGHAMDALEGALRDAAADRLVTKEDRFTDCGVRDQGDARLS